MVKQEGMEDRQGMNNKADSSFTFLDRSEQERQHSECSRASVCQGSNLAVD